MKETCPWCCGTGTLLCSMEIEACGLCNGTGQVTPEVRDREVERLGY